MRQSFRQNLVRALVAGLTVGAPLLFALPTEGDGGASASTSKVHRALLKSKSRHASSKRAHRDPASDTTNSLSANEIREIKAKISRLSDEIDMIQAEMEVMRAESRAVIQRTHLGFLNQFYIKGGISVIVPRPRTFDFHTDTGLGAFIGIGHYIGRNHVVDLSLEWDLYPSLSLRYRYEFHLDSPLITWAPVIGVKIKAAPIPPFDNYLDHPDDVKSSFLMLGGMVAFPLERSLITIELLYLANQQSFIFTNFGLHFFL